MEKQQLIQYLHELLKTNEQIQAAWLGGSDATGKADALSDIDLVMICEDKDFPFILLESSLSIEQTYIVHDGPYIQRFYILKDTPSSFYLDVVVFTEMEPTFYQEYFNKGRHGTPLILFDRKDILKEAASVTVEECPVIDPENELARFEIIFRTFQKEALRGRFLDAFNFYLREITLLTRILRVKYSPQKHDFGGFRYLHNDLPSDEAAFIENMLKVSDLQEMVQNSRSIKERMKSLLKKEDA